MNGKIYSIFRRGSNIGAGWIYFYIHFITETVCFFLLVRLTGDSAALWLLPLVYDELAFIPQTVIGRFSDKYPKFNLALPGAAMLAVSCLFFPQNTTFIKYIALIILCLGNALIHINGAEATLRSCHGKLSNSAIFVAGGSFGIIVGRVLGASLIPSWAMTFISLSIVPFAMLGEYYKKDSDPDPVCEGFNYHSEKLPGMVVVLLAMLIVTVRGYMGYGIPTSWNKTLVQNVLLYVFMGIGKALGGVLADIFGIRKIGIVSVVAALPFLIIGDRNMVLSLFGVMLFSMTMSLTLAILVSVLKKAPGFAFGLTTTALFLGSAPIFFFKLTTVRSNCIMLSVLTLFCVFAFLAITRKDEKR